MFCLLVVVVSKAAREKLKYALQVLFCIAPPSHCVLWQQPVLIRGVHAGTEICDHNFFYLIAAVAE